MINNNSNNKCVNLDGVELIYDRRCCGTCYCLCPSKAQDKQCNMCDNNVYDFCNSGYIQTHDGLGNSEDVQGKECNMDNCFCTVLCFPFKFTLFFPCFIGSIFNGCINKLASTNKNYIF